MSPDDLFSVDLDGKRQSFDDLVADGLDRDYSARFPTLRALLAGGTPRDQLFAAAMLAAWGVRDGYLAIVAWAAAPERVPWASEPVVRDRFTSVDSAFAMLAHSIGVSQDVRHTEAGTLLRVGATRALLAIYHRVNFERELYTTLDIDDALAKRCRQAIELAVDHAIKSSTAKPPFDLASQAAFLIGPLARLDDARAAAAGDALLALHPDNERAGKEVALAMASGSGAATMAVLERMVKVTTGAVRTEAEQSIDRRRGKVVS